MEKCGGNGLVNRFVTALFLIVFIFGFIYVPGVNYAQQSGRTGVDISAGPENTLGEQSDSDIWRQIREGAQGTGTLKSHPTGSLIQSQGQDWRLLRTQLIMPLGLWILLSITALVSVFFVVRGRIRIKAGRSVRKIPRFSLNQRIIHWFVAGLFILLGTSGLILLYGRPLLVPLIGKSSFGLIASASMQGHNLFGPLFLFGIAALFFSFVRGNFLSLVDFSWLIRGGGFFGGHASSGRYNLGEKVWFWWAVILGLILSVSGLVMSFPWIIPGLELLQLANLAHGAAAILFIAFGIGHIYLGTVGMEGAMEAMTEGTVDANWAREHHDLWYEEMTGDQVPTQDEMVSPGAYEKPIPGTGKI